MSLNSCWQFGNILSLSSNDRICSFNWIKGSKHCLLTSFSNLNCYILFLVFLRNHYLLVISHISRLCKNPISHPVFIPFVLQIPRCTCAPIFLAYITRFLEVRCSWEPGTWISTGFSSLFRLSPKVSYSNVRWAIAKHTFFSHIIFSNWHFLAWHKPPLSQRSTAWERNPQGISKLLNKGWLLLVWQQLLDNFSGALCTWLLSSWFFSLWSIW